MIRAIFFDAVGTLIHLPRGVGFHYREIGVRHGVEASEAELATAFRRAWREMPQRPPTLAPRADDDKAWWRELVGRVLNLCHANATNADHFFEELYARFSEPGVWELYPEVKPVLRELSKNHGLGIISNFDGRLRVILNQLNVTPHFRHIVISSETGADKPAAFIFQTALKKLGVAPHEALHVGDDPIQDWQGAEAAGLHCFRLDRRRNSLSDLTAFAAALGS